MFLDTTFKVRTRDRILTLLLSLHNILQYKYMNDNYVEYWIPPEGPFAPC